MITIEAAACTLQVVGSHLNGLEVEQAVSSPRQAQVARPDDHHVGDDADVGGGDYDSGDGGNS